VCAVDFRPCSGVVLIVWGFGGNVDLVQVVSVGAEFIRVTVLRISVIEAVKLRLVDVQVRRRGLPAFAIELRLFVAGKGGIPGTTAAASTRREAVGPTEKTFTAVACEWDLDVTALRCREVEGVFDHWVFFIL
jgi:hypothetical protein